MIKRIVFLTFILATLLMMTNPLWADTIWSENFESYNDNSGYIGPDNSTTGDYPGSVTKWSLDVSSATLSAVDDWFMVNSVSSNLMFEGKDLDGVAIWTSESININGYTGVSITLDIAESGDMEGTDYIKGSYKIDGGSEIEFFSDADDLPGGTTWVERSKTGLSGSTLVVIIKVINNAGTEMWRFDNIVIAGTPGVGAPTVTISAADPVEETTARINGNVTATGGADPDVTQYWGTSDGVQTPGNWTNNSVPTSPAQPQGVAAFYKDVTGLTQGTLYHFSAKATNSGGTGWPASSLTFLTKPNEPTGLSVTGHTKDSISLSWTKGTGAQKTMIRYRTDQYPTGASDGTQAYFDTGTSTTVSTLSNGQIYYFRAWCYATEGGKEQYSDLTSDVTDYTNPGDPSALDAKTPGMTTIALAWTKGTGGDKTMIRYRTDQYPTGTSDGTQAYFDTGTSTTVTTLSNGQIYYFRAWAYDSDSLYYSDSYSSDSETTLSLRDVVVNEIAYRGTVSATGAEWIELYNNTGSSINITDWSIKNLDTAVTLNINSTNFASNDAGYVIPANGYITLVNDSTVYSGANVWDLSDLTIGMNDDVSEGLILYTGLNGTGGTIDTAGADASDWFVFLAQGESMERRNPTASGTNSTNWAKCSTQGPELDASSNQIKGTPGRQNSCHDETAPTVSNVTSTTANDSYKAAEVIAVTVEFSENVYVIGTPQIELETGATDRKADYASGTGGTTLTFNYTVQAGDTSGDLDYTGTDALTLNGGTIKDIALNDANRTLAAPAAEHSLGYNKAIIIDTTAPDAPSTPNLAAADDTGISDSDDITNLTTGLTFSGTAEAASTVELFDGAISKGTTTATSGTWSKDITLETGTRYIKATATDAADNTSIDSDTLSVIVDTTNPTILITSVTSSQGTDNWYEQAATVTYWYSDDDSIAHTVTIGGTLNDTGGAEVWKTEYSACFGETGTTDTGATFSSNEYEIAIGGGDSQGSIIVTGYDNAGNTHTDTVTFNEDNAVPASVTISGVSDSPDNLHYTGGTLYYSNDQVMTDLFTVTVTASDAGSDLQKCVGENGFGETAPDDTTYSDGFDIEYTVNQSESETSPLTMTVYDNVDNTATVDLTIALDNTAPANVGCSTPVDDAKGQSIDPTLTALTATDTAGAGVASYSFQLDTATSFDSDGGNPLQSRGWLPSNSWSPSTLSTDTTYYWRVKTKDNVGNEKSVWCGHTADTEGYGTFKTAAVDHPVISEVQIAGGVAADDFVEIYNPTGYDINLGSFKDNYIRLVRRTQLVVENTSLKSWKDETAIVPAYGYYLWGVTTSYDGPIPADITGTLTVTSNNSLALEKGIGGGYWDQVAIGSGHTAPLVETTAYPTNPVAHTSIERRPGCPLGNATDDGNNSTDFKAQDTPNPQNSNCPTVLSINPTSGGASTVITITGTNFVTLPVVELWSSSAKVADCDDESFTGATEISAKIPTSGLTNDVTYYVVVKNPDNPPTSYGQQNYLTPGGFTFTGSGVTTISITNWRELY